MKANEIIKSIPIFIGGSKVGELKASTKFIKHLEESNEQLNKKIKQKND